MAWAERLESGLLPDAARALLPRVWVVSGMDPSTEPHERTGMAVLLALYAAVTVLLARPVLGERMRAVQRVGLALGALGIVLVTA